MHKPEDRLGLLMSLHSFFLATPLYVTEFTARIVKNNLEDERRRRGDDILVAGMTNRPEKVHEKS